MRAWVEQKLEPFSRPVLPEEGTFWGLLAELTTPAALYHACESMRDAAYRPRRR